MRISLTIADELYDLYSARAEEMQGRNGKTVSAESLMEAHLDRFKSTHPGDRVVVIDSESREKLENLLSGGTLRDGKDLVAKVQALADLHIGEVRVPFTPGELTQLKQYATRNNKSLQSVIEQTVKQMGSQFFDYIT
jgi:hypothetical protein